MKGKATTYTKLSHQAKGVEKKIKATKAGAKKEMLGRVLGDILKRKRGISRGR